MKSKREIVKVVDPQNIFSTKYRKFITDFLQNTGRGNELIS